MPRVNIYRLEVSDNQLAGKELERLSIYKNTLTVLKIRKNQIKAPSELDCLKGFGKLSELDLTDNPICDEDGYRTKVFEALPELKYLDGQDVDGKDKPESDGDEEDQEGDQDEEITVPDTDEDYIRYIKTRLNPDEFLHLLNSKEVDAEWLEKRQIRLLDDESDEEGKKPGQKKRQTREKAADDEDENEIQANYEGKKR